MDWRLRTDATGTAEPPHATRRRALTALASQARQVAAALDRQRARVAALMDAEAALPPGRRLPGHLLAEARSSGWELKRLQGELRRLRAALDAIRYGRPSH